MADPTVPLMALIVLGIAAIDAGFFLAAAARNVRQYTRRSVATVTTAVVLAIINVLALVLVLNICYATGWFTPQT